MEWVTLTLRITTPLFNGGADPDGSVGFGSREEAGVRVASIRGAMRFWFRALAGTIAGSDLNLLAAMERRVFGGIAEQRGGEEAAHASPLMLRIPDPPRPSLDASFLRGNEEKWLGYLLGLGLMKPERRALRLLRPCVSPDADPFELKIGFRHDRRTDEKTKQAIEALAVTSLWLVCAYGGMGARIRRGFGGVRIVDAAGPLPPPWTSRGVLTPGLELYQNVEWLWPSATAFGIFERYLRDLVPGAAGAPDRWPGPPDYPVLSKRYSPALLAQRRFGSWSEALSYGGRQLRLFRANRPESEDRRRQAQVRTAEWDDVVNGDSADFPLGALGLPVGYHDKRDNRKFMVNAVIPRDPEPEELRRASPLWIRPVCSGDSWRLFTFAFLTRFLPGTARVRLAPDEHASRDGWLNIAPDDAEHLTLQWMQALKVGGDFTRLIRD